MIVLIARAVGFDFRDTNGGFTGALRISKEKRIIYELASLCAQSKPTCCIDLKINLKAFSWNKKLSVSYFRFSDIALFYEDNDPTDITDVNVCVCVFRLFFFYVRITGAIFKKTFLSEISSETLTT